MIRALPLLCLLGAASAVPVYVMLPLNTITTDNKISDPTTLQQQLQQLKSIGVAGFMMDGASSCRGIGPAGLSPQSIGFHLALVLGVPSSVAPPHESRAHPLAPRSLPRPFRHATVRCSLVWHL